MCRATHVEIAEAVLEGEVVRLAIHLENLSDRPMSHVFIRLIHVVQRARPVPMSETFGIPSLPGSTVATFEKLRHRSLSDHKVEVVSCEWAR